MKSGGRNIRENKKAQMKISFGMIFSIILIIVFLAFAFWGIKKLLGVQEAAMIAKFKSDVQRDVDRVWNGPQGNESVGYKLPKKIEGVCFNEDSYENFYFEPRKYGAGFVEHIDVNERVCFVNTDGEIRINLSKDFKENLVTISRN